MGWIRQLPDDNTWAPPVFFDGFWDIKADLDSSKYNVTRKALWSLRGWWPVYLNGFSFTATASFHFLLGLAESIYSSLIDLLRRRKSSYWHLVGVLFLPKSCPEVINKLNCTIVVNNKQFLVDTPWVHFQLGELGLEGSKLLATWVLDDHVIKLRKCPWTIEQRHRTHSTIDARHLTWFLLLLEVTFRTDNGLSFEV